MTEKEEMLEEEEMMEEEEMREEEGVTEEEKMTIGERLEEKADPGPDQDQKEDTSHVGEKKQST